MIWPLAKLDLRKALPWYLGALAALVGQGRVSLGRLEKALGGKKASAVVSQLVKKGLLARTYEPEPIRVRPKTELYIKLSGNIEEGLQLRGKQAVLLEFLRGQSAPLPWAEAREKTGCSKAVAEVLLKKGLGLSATGTMCRLLCGP